MAAWTILPEHPSRWSCSHPPASSHEASSGSGWRFTPSDEHLSEGAREAGAMNKRLVQGRGGSGSSSVLRGRDRAEAVRAESGK